MRVCPNVIVHICEREKDGVCVIVYSCDSVCSGKCVCVCLSVAVYSCINVTLGALEGERLCVCVKEREGCVRV